MILIGQYDSPFVRRVGVTLTLYGLPFEHRPWSIFGDADRIAPINPLIRVPVLVLDDGEALIETFAILDYLDHLAPAGAALLPGHGVERRRALQVCAMASGLSDKAVSLFYELRLHQEASLTYVERWHRQIHGTLERLEADRAGARTLHWCGERLTHADIAVAASLRHLRDAHPTLFDSTRYPSLAANCERMEAMPVMREISQPFIAPA
jgi:glutathione S-transferase